MGSAIPTMNGYTFIDDYSRNTFVYLLRNRSEVFHVIQNFFTFVENQYQTRVQIFRSGNVKEYTSHQVQDYLDIKGIIHETSCSYTTL